MSVRTLVLLLCAWPAVGLFADGPLKVVTYNIRYASPKDGLDVWPNRVETVSRVIAENDVIGLQEVTLRQLNDLRDRLTDFDWYGVGRDDGKSGGEHAVIFYRRDRIEAVDKGTIWLSPTPDQIGVKGWDAALPRTCTWMIVRDKESGDKIWVANTHFDHRGAVARTESAKLIRQFALENSESLPVVVMGDFNCLPGSEPYLALTSANSEPTKALTDARLSSGVKPSGPSSTWCGFREIVPGRIIDHIFVNNRVKVLSFETLDPKTDAGRFASDHLPVRVNVESDRAEGVRPPE